MRFLSKSRFVVYIESVCMCVCGTTVIREALMSLTIASSMYSEKSLVHSLSLLSVRSAIAD